MHLLAAQPGVIDDGTEAVDLGQSPGDMVFLSAADTELALLAAARDKLAGDGYPSLRLASLLHLGHNMSVDLYVDGVIGHARLVIVRLLGGRGYWPYGVEQVVAECREKGIALALLPGDDSADPELTGLSNLPTEACHRLWQYCVHGGVDNALEFLNYSASLIGAEADWREPRPLLRAGLYWPGLERPDRDAVRAHWVTGAPVAAMVFYRALVQAANLGAVDAMVDGLAAEGLNPLPIYVTSLKDEVAAATVASLLADDPSAVVLNATGFSVSAPGAKRRAAPFDGADCPVLQVVFSSGNEETWRAGTRGLSATDIAMNVVLPEVDGRIFTRAVSFKGLARRDGVTQTDIVRYRPVPDRIAFVSEMARRWAWLGRTPPSQRRIALVFANYPNRDGRMGNGVGLDTPAAAIQVLGALSDAGYAAGTIPEDGDKLMARLADARPGRSENPETLSLDAYQAFFGGLPEAARSKINDRWGRPADDPFFAKDKGFRIPAFRLGNVAVCLQPSRGYDIDPVTTYHSPDLVPPHGYLAFYAWIRGEFGADAVVHMGKHGNLEWLPGKALALSPECMVEAAFGALPHLYPFIVNDPGEGAQAKRRAGAVIVDHLTPPLTRAESYGVLRDLEQLVDEYFEAAGMDPRRCRVLRADILGLCQATGLDADCGMVAGDDEDQALGKLDNYLCELKEMQIRDGLHVFGVSPEAGPLHDLLVALVRVPRGKDPGDASLIRALASDLNLDIDPLDCDLGHPWTGPRPGALNGGDDSWRSCGDTVERLEGLALALVAGVSSADAGWTGTRAVLDELERRIRPAVEASGGAELKGLLDGLDGRFVEPGPSGAPTRGRPDVLPTGRNFYSVDTRTVPTPAAWTLGWKSAALLVERHLQEHGAWPRSMALTAWGTSNMRTGGDDIAQGLALMGARPTWEAARVTGFEVLPLSILDRPRVDVMLRVSGFFRDAFPSLIDLFDSAARTIAALDEAEDLNPLAANARAESSRLMETGMIEAEAVRRAGYRVFGSKPGAYGAGLQALIDERGWETDADLARAYVAWGGYAYGAGAEGRPAHGLFETRLKGVDAVVQNQDNREHDLLDSDDYYQFEGGMTAAVRHLSGVQPAAYHMDHSRPETPRARTLDEEIARVVRARVVNPKWIKGVMRHGYKGAFEMAATVDYLFAFAATAHAVRDHHFDAVFEAYLGDGDVRAFIAEHNPAALREMAERLLEAQARGLWRPRLNSTHGMLAELKGGA